MNLNLYHVNPKSGAIGRCSAEKRSCPFGSDFHSEDFMEARRIAEEIFSKESPLFPRKPVKKEYSFDWFEGKNYSIELSNDEPRPVSSKSVVLRLLNQNGKSVSIIAFRYLPGRRINFLWRENFKNSPRGASAVLQKVIEYTHSDFTFASHPQEMSPDAQEFRRKFLEHNPKTKWELDLSAGSDPGEEIDYISSIDDSEASSLQLDNVWKNLDGIMINHLGE